LPPRGAHPSRLQRQRPHAAGSLLIQQVTAYRALLKSAIALTNEDAKADQGNEESEPRPPSGILDGSVLAVAGQKGGRYPDDANRQLLYNRTC